MADLDQTAGGGAPQGTQKATGNARVPPPRHAPATAGDGTRADRRFTDMPFPSFHQFPARYCGPSFPVSLPSAEAAAEELKALENTRDERCEKAKAQAESIEKSATKRIQPSDVTMEERRELAKVDVLMLRLKTLWRMGPQRKTNQRHAPVVWCGGQTTHFGTSDPPTEIMSCRVGSLCHDIVMSIVSGRQVVGYLSLVIFRCARCRRAALRPLENSAARHSLCRKFPDFTHGIAACAWSLLRCRALAPHTPAPPTSECRFRI